MFDAFSPGIGIPVDFALTLLGVALTRLAVISVYNVVFTGFKFGTGLGGSASTSRMSE